MTLEEASARLNAMAERRARRAIDYRESSERMLEGLGEIGRVTRHLAEDYAAKYLRDAEFAEADASAITLILLHLSVAQGETDGRRRNEPQDEANNAGAAAG